MKRFILFLSAVISLNTYSQGFEGIVVEAIPVPENIAQSDAALKTGSVTYRVFVDLADNYGLQSVYCESGNPLVFGTNTEFFNHFRGEYLGQNINKDSLIKYPALAYDSWITVNAASNSDLGVLYDEDGDETVDGLISGTSTSVTANSFFNTPFGKNNYSGTYSTSLYYYLVFPPVTGPANTGNKVLIGQFTTDSIFNFELNIELRNLDTDAIEKYVAKNAGANEQLSGDLTFTNVGCNNIAACNYSPLHLIEDNSACLIPVPGCQECENDTIKDVDANNDGIPDCQLKYYIDTVSAYCGQSNFCIPIKTLEPVNEIIGFETSMKYDPGKVSPNGVVIIGNDLIDPFYTEYAANVNEDDSTIVIAVYLNQNAPANAGFSGQGELFCIQFNAITPISLSDTFKFEISDFAESYFNDTHQTFVKPGYIHAVADHNFDGIIRNWSDNRPLVYNSATPVANAPTTIFGNNSDGNNRSADSLLPNTLGWFDYSLSMGTHAEIVKDIDSSANINSVVNGMDAILAQKVVIDDQSFTPNLYQLIAMDVNMDGKISSGDISQINMRTVRVTPEFKQKWNYISNEQSNGQKSKDWVFARKNSLDSITNYGKRNVPVLSHFIQCPADTLCSIEDQEYVGILLGDIDGSYANIPQDGLLKKVSITTLSDTIMLDINNATVTEIDGRLDSVYLNIPVVIKSTSESFDAIDLTVIFDTNKCSFIEVTNYLPGFLYQNGGFILANVPTSNKTELLITGGINLPGDIDIPTNTAIYELRFAVHKKIKPEDFELKIALLNGTVNAFGKAEGSFLPLDNIAPVVTLPNGNEYNAINESVDIINNEDGIAYLVPAETSAEISSIRANTVDSTITIENALASLQFPIETNSYWVYTRDETGNISNHKAVSVIKSQALGFMLLDANDFPATELFEITEGMQIDVQEVGTYLNVRTITETEPLSFDYNCQMILRIDDEIPYLKNDTIAPYALWYEENGFYGGETPILNKNYKLEAYPVEGKANPAFPIAGLDKKVVNFSFYDSSTDIDKLNGLNIDIYPNPVKDYLHLKHNHKVTLTALLRDITGKTISSFEIRNGVKTSVDVSGLKGVYFLNIQSGANKHVQKIIIE